MNIALMQQALHGSEAGQFTFPQAVGLLREAGVESYEVDLLHGDDTFYLSSGETHIEPLQHTGTTVAEDFNQPQVVAAIRAAQADQIRYPEFLRRITAAGVANYRTYITGARVLYLGRKGDMHVEHFPKPAS